MMLERNTERKFGLADIQKSIEKSRATIYSVITGLRFLGLSREMQIERAKITLADELGRVFVNNRGGLTNAIREYQSDEVEARIALQTTIFSVSELSGGYTDYLEKPEDAESIYSGIFNVINNRYVIGYYPTNQERDGKMRNVKIEVKNHPEYIIIGRKSYLAPEN